jgi:mono/diheme cytochrome c family protein
MCKALIKGLLILAFALSGVLTPAVHGEGDPKAGVQIYKSNCAACHGANMEGSIAPPLKDNAFVADSEESVIVNTIANGREEKGMPAFKDQLTEQQLADVVALLKNPSEMTSAQSTVVIEVFEPEITTEDILPGLKRSFLFVYLWTLVAMIALLVWIKHRS